MAAVFKIAPTTQKYDWGKIGLSSKVAQYAIASGLSDFQLEENAPYAELWMGTHHTSPSRVLGSPTQEKLSDYLAAHPELIGQRVIEQFKAEGAAEGNLPFLFKVLSIEKALSIQTHPDKEMAKRLHAERPDVYKDANHKPEMAVALTDFQALCGFMPLPRIADYLTDTPEFAALVPKAITEQFLSIASSTDPTGPSEKRALQDLFSAVMTAQESDVKVQLEKLISRYTAGDVRSSEKDVVDLVLRLHDQFPGDIGVFCAFLLNHMTLKPGEAIFLRAGEPHAYVSGDIIECMATSDNVIRAGLTPKLRDVPNLIAGLTYTSASPDKHVVQPTTCNRPSVFTVEYPAPVPEFSVLCSVVPPGETETHSAIDGPGVAIITEGKGVVVWEDTNTLNVSEGEVIFVGANHEIKFSAEQQQLIMHRAILETSGKI